MFKSEIPCKKCQKSHYIQNKVKHLCSECIYMENHMGKTRFEIAIEKQKNKPIKKYYIGKSIKRDGVLGRDRKAYEYWFNTLPNKCLECEEMLPNEFLDENGNILLISQYSHILGKGAYPEFRHHKLNCNRLCFNCHQTWDFGDKENMKIFSTNQEIIKKIKETPENLI